MFNMLLHGDPKEVERMLKTKRILDQAKDTEEEKLIHLKHKDCFIVNLAEGILSEIKDFLTPDERRIFKLTCKYIRKTINHS